MELDTQGSKLTVQRLGPSVPAGKSAKAGSGRSSANDCRVSEEGNQSSGTYCDWKKKVSVLARDLAGKLNALQKFTGSTRNVHRSLKDGVAVADNLAQELCDLLTRHLTTEAPPKRAVGATSAKPDRGVAGVVAQCHKAPSPVVATRARPDKGVAGVVAQYHKAPSPVVATGAKPDKGVAEGVAQCPKAPPVGNTKSPPAVAPSVSRQLPKAKAAVVAKPNASAKRPPSAPARKTTRPTPKAMPPKKTTGAVIGTPETSTAGGPMEGRKKRRKKAAKERDRGNPAPDSVLATSKPPQGEPGTKGRKRLNRVLAPALLIKKAPPVEATAAPTEPTISFADVIRRMTELASETSPTVSARSISRTRKGDLLIRVASAAFHQMAEIASKAAGPGMVVERLLPKRTVVLKDLDMSITPGDVSRILGAAFEPEERDRLQVHSLRPGHSGTQCCTISVPDTGKAKRLIKDGRVKIGLVMCRVRERRAVLQCYRCLGFGHTAHGCKAVDRSKLCRNCMQTGHQMGSCPNNPWCPLCAEMQNGSRGATHRLGGEDCKARKGFRSGTRRR
jgi:hypothetical protein